MAEIASTTFIPSALLPGDIGSLAVDIRNRGTGISIQNMTATLELGDEFEGLELVDEIAVINPEATTTAIFRFRVKENTLPAFYPALLTLEYSREGDLVTFRESISIPVSRAEKNVNVTVEPRIINPGNQTELIFTLANIGGTPVSNISFSWEEENDLVLPLGSDNKKYISIIFPHESAEILYVVAADPNIVPGIYPLDVTIKFTDVNGTQTQTSQVGIIIGGKTDFEVSAEILNTGQLSLSIANIGSNNAQAVVVRIPSQSGIQISGSSTAILGNLNKGDFTLANFDLTQRRFGASSSGDETGTTRGGFPFTRRFQNNGSVEAEQRSSPIENGNISTNEIQIEIDYTDTTGERQTALKLVELNLGAGFSPAGVSSARGGSGGFALISWIILVLIVGGALLYNKQKAKKSWKNVGIFLGVIMILFLAAIFFGSANQLLILTITALSVAGLIWFFLKSPF